MLNGVIIINCREEIELVDQRREVELFSKKVRSKLIERLNSVNTVSKRILSRIVLAVCGSKQGAPRPVRTRTGALFISFGDKLFLCQKRVIHLLLY